MSNFPANKTAEIKTLTPYARNSRTHSDVQIDKIARSIKEFGFLNPVIVDGAGGIVAGHGRVLAAEKLGLSTVPVIVAEHLTEDQKKAYIIADNRLALDAGWDDSILRFEISGLIDSGFDVSLTGFEVPEIDALFYEPAPPEDTEPEMPPENPITAPGDIYILGRHRLMCGDSTNQSHVDALLNGADWDVCVFDPPYEIESLYRDAMPVAKNGKRLLVMWDFKRFAIAPAAALSAGWTPQYELIWDCVQSWYTPNRPLQRHKAIGIFGDDPHFDTESSIIVDGKNRGAARTVKNTRGDCNYTPLKGAKHISTVEAFSNTSESDEHGHGKPLKWIEPIFRGVGGGCYLDLFGGSGSTMIACENIGTSCFMMELSPHYCDVIVSRWETHTGATAHRIKAEK